MANLTVKEMQVKIRSLKDERKALSDRNLEILETVRENVEKRARMSEEIKDLAVKIRESHEQDRRDRREERETEKAESKKPVKNPEKKGTPAPKTQNLVTSDGKFTEPQKPAAQHLQTGIQG